MLGQVMEGLVIYNPSGLRVMGMSKPSHDNAAKLKILAGGVCLAREGCAKSRQIKVSTKPALVHVSNGLLPLTKRLYTNR